MSHAFSKTCKVCQSKQLEEAREKLKKQDEERDLHERRERNKELREQMLRDEEERRRKADEERVRRRHEARREREEQQEREERERKMQMKMDQLDNDEDYGGAGGGDSPDYDYGASSQVSEERKPKEKRLSKKDKVGDWEFSLRIFMADEPFDSIATPIFAQTDENRPMFRLFQHELADKTFILHTPRRIQKFLIDSNSAMNLNRSCAFSVLKLQPTDRSSSYHKVLDYNLDQDTVYQLNYDLNEEILSVFLFPHRGSEILHDTFAPVKYNIGTTENCFMLIMVLHSAYGVRFPYSVRLSDIEMKVQLHRMEREKAVMNSWQMEEEREKEQLRKKRMRSRSRSRSPQNGDKPGPSELTPEELAARKFKFILEIVQSAVKIGSFTNINDSTVPFSRRHSSLGP